jgi:hypothetical protein
MLSLKAVIFQSCWFYAALRNRYLLMEANSGWFMASYA